MSDSDAESKTAAIPFDDLKKAVREVLAEKDAEDAPGRQVGRRAVNTRLEADSLAEDKIHEALRKIQREDDERREREATAGKLKALEDKVKEKPPVQRSGLHKFMNWGEPAE